MVGVVVGMVGVFGMVVIMGMVGVVWFVRVVRWGCCNGRDAANRLYECKSVKMKSTILLLAF